MQITEKEAAIALKKYTGELRHDEYGSPCFMLDNETALLIGIGNGNTEATWIEYHLLINTENLKPHAI